MALPRIARSFLQGGRPYRPLLAPLFQAAGCHGMELQRSIEVLARYWLLVRREDVDSHMVGFRQSAAFAKWRELVRAHFAVLPQIEHGAVVLLGRLAPSKRTLS